MDKFNQVVTPMYEIGDDGAIMPNPLFHRSWDKLHSRCIEYPFAAAHLGASKKILDVGIVKSDPLWIRWLESLSIEVHAVDYDLPKSNFKNIVFHKADLRKLPLVANTFEKVLAISVIEHIGMVDPQVVSENLPTHEKDGDINAVEELMRVLKPGGELVMTLPFGKPDGLIADNSTRVYTLDTIKRFEKYGSLISLEYYEYQYSKYQNIYPEFVCKNSRRERLKDVIFGKKKEYLNPVCENQRPKHFGMVTWRRLPLECASAIHYRHADGIVCGVWMKNNTSL